jgi:peroxiredoxin
MALVPSTMPDLGLPAPRFSLPDAAGGTVSIDDFSDAPVLLVAFWCSHCPFVRHIREEFAAFAREYQAKNVAVVAISSNDDASHPQDGPEQMRADVEAFGYTFPYLRDATQEVARAYEAACTPDFFLYNENRRLVYRGRFDGATPSNDVPVTGADMRVAVDALLAGQPLAPEQTPSIGCNIKWKQG